MLQNGDYLDSCVYLGSNSSYSASENDNVFLETEEEIHPLDTQEDRRKDVVAPAVGSTEFVIELQVTNRAF